MPRSANRETQISNERRRTPSDVRAPEGTGAMVIGRPPMISADDMLAVRAFPRGALGRPAEPARSRRMISPRRVAAVLPPAGGPVYPAEFHFTPRETQILRLIACDRSDKEVARSLGISQHTLRTHLSRLYERHGVHSRAAAVARWLLGSSALPSLLGDLGASAMTLQRPTCYRELRLTCRVAPKLGAAL